MNEKQIQGKTEVPLLKQRRQQHEHLLINYIIELGKNIVHH